MTTDKEKLQKIFEAALREPDLSANRGREMFNPEEVSKPQRLDDSSASPPADDDTPPVSVQVDPVAVATLPNEYVASEELSALLDEQHRRKSRCRRVESLITLAVLLAGLAGGWTWFNSDSHRKQALREVMDDIHTLSDARLIAAKYNAALDRIAARGQQIDQASAALGVDSTKEVSAGALDAQMKEVSGGEMTPLQRAEALKKNLSNFKQSAGVKDDPKSQETAPE